MTPENKIKSLTNYDEHLDFLLALIIGDGHLTHTGRLVIAHGKQQQDYCEWKANRLGLILNQETKAYPTRQCYQVQIQRKYFKEIHPLLYTEKRKNVVQLLSMVRNVLEFIAIWLMDDGNCCPSVNKKGVVLSESLQIFTFTDLETSMFICEWFEKKIGIRPYTIFRDRSKTNRKSAYIIKFRANDSRKLFKMIYKYIPNIQSMNYKFRYLFARSIEYNLSTSPRQLDDNN